MFNDLKQLILYYGSVEVNMGNDENMDEKMNRLIGILPQLKGMKGVLHLENVTEDTASVVFDNAEAKADTDEDSGDAREGEESGDILDEDTGESGAGKKMGRTQTQRKAQRKKQALMKILPGRPCFRYPGYRVRAGEKRLRY